MTTTSRSRRPLFVLAAVASVVALGLTGCGKIVDRSDLELGTAITIDPVSSQASEDARVSIAVTDFERVSDDEVATWESFDATGVDVFRASADLEVVEGTFPQEGLNGFETDNWGLVVDDEVVKPNRLNGALLQDEDFISACPLYDAALTPVLADEGEATACLVLTAPTGAEPTRVLFDDFFESTRRTTNKGEATWVVDGS
ncbi:hypothetical protein [Frigoribacterium faeni]|uniref:hypothetical protein n=1 Tax=Frigoribacterium faeni TaxID=145483 RepID=UPI00141AF025|nr:hypothetical protein [Frigoribacterium faeni]NIJ05420.1 hypothetical protein [Frigoribacterium faeni]